MAVDESSRLHLTTWSADTDPFTRDQMMDSVTALEDNAAKYLSGTFANLPIASAENDRSFYWAWDSQQLFFCNDGLWRETIWQVDATTIENFGNGAIRIKSGGVSESHLNSTVKSGTGIFVRRDGASNAMTGRLSLVDLDPEETYHAARKSYVDGPYVYCTDGVAQSFTNTTYATVKFLSAVADTGDDFNTTTGVFTVPRSGAYLVSSTIKAPGDSSVYFRFRIRREMSGGQEKIFEGPRFRPNNITGVSTEPAILCFSHAVRADVGEKIYIQCLPSTGGTYTLGQELTITWLHGAPATFTG